MSHTIEKAASGRAKCRGCKRTISKDELRFGERLPNPFADGEMTIWFHLVCAAYRRPSSLGELLKEEPDHNDSLSALSLNFNQTIKMGLEHDRLTRIAGAEVSPSNRAKCRCCKEPIKKDSYRIALEFFEEGMFNPSGYIHTECSSDYFGTINIFDRVKHFAVDLEDEALTELGEAIA